MAEAGSEDQRLRDLADALSSVNPQSLGRLVACLSGLGPDPNENIQHLADICGELLGADSAFYSRTHDGMIWFRGRHAAAADLNPADRAQCRLCHDAIAQDADETVLIQGPGGGTEQASSDAPQSPCGLDTCAARAVRARGRMVGALCVGYRRRRDLSEEETAILAVVSAALGAEEEQRLAGETLRRRERYLECVAESSADLLHSDDYRVSVPQVLQRLRQAVRAQRCYLVENALETDGTVVGHFRFEAVCGEGGALPSLAESEPIRWSCPALQPWVETLSTGGAVWGTSEQLPAAQSEILRQAGIRWAAVLPLHVRGRWRGAIALDTAEEGFSLTPEEIGLLGSVAQAVSAAMERTRTEGERRALEQLALELVGEADIQSIIESVQEVSLRLLGWDAFYFAVRRPDEEEFTAAYFVDTVAGERRRFPGCTWRLAADSYHDRQLWAGRPVLLDHEVIDDEQGSERFGDTDRPSRCLMFVPVGSPRRVIGIISAQSYTPTRYDAADLELLGRTADAAAPALDRAFALEAVSRRAREADVLHSLAVALGEAEDEDQLVANALAAALQLSGLEGGAAFLIDDEGSQFVLRHCTGALRHLAGELSTLAVDSPQARAAVAARGVLSLRDLAASHEGVSDWIARAGLEDAFAAPILSPDGPVGVLLVGTAISTRRLPQAARNALNSAATELGTALRRHRAEQALHRSERRFREMSDLLPEMVYEADPSFRFVYANRSAMQTLGYSLQDIERGLSLSDLLRPGDQQRARQFARRVERQFTTAVEEFSIRRKDGSEIPCEISVAAIRGGDGRVSGYRGVVRDVSERVRAQHTERLAVVGQLAAGVAHEFNNILAATRAGAQAAQITDDPADLQELIATVLAGAGRGAEICRSLLGFARPVQARRESIQISRPVGDALAMVAQQLELGHVNWRLGDHTRGVAVSADAGQLQQVFLNLFLNACRAMPEGGLLSVEATTELEPGGTAQIVVRVSDTGLGIAPEHLPHVFEPFFTTWSAETGENGAGTGLGLSVSSEIVAAHGGTLSVRSTVGQGTVFELRLPGEIATSWTGSPPLPEPMAPAAALDGSVLLAEDDRPLRRSLAVALRHAGCEVLEAASTEEALSILQTHRVDVVISDLMMPGGGGRAVLSAAQKVENSPPVVVITGMDQQSLAPELFQLGAAECLQKPFELHDLVALVGRLHPR